MKPLDLSAVDHIIRDVAASEIMPRFRTLSAGDIIMKGVNDPVTTADREAERALTLLLTDYLPGSVVVGEEGFAADPAILSHFGGEADVWVIDPIDGTRNFIEGKSEFGVMIALVRRRQTVAAWIHDPSSGDTLMAEQGGGVWLRGQRTRLAGHDAATPPVCIIGSRLKKTMASPEMTALAERLPTLMIGSAAAFDYARLFTGNAHFADSTAARAAFLLYRQSKPWDHLPGLFLLHEAGGYAADLRGQPYDAAQAQNGLLIAPGAAAWQNFHAAFAPAIDRLILD